MVLIINVPLYAMFSKSNYDPLIGTEKRMALTLGRWAPLTLLLLWGCLCFNLYLISLFTAEICRKRPYWHIFLILKIIWSLYMWIVSLQCILITICFWLTRLSNTQQTTTVSPYTLLQKIKGTWSAPSLVCGHSQVQLLEDMHNCTSLKSLTIDFTCNEFDTTLAPL